MAVSPLGVLPPRFPLGCLLTLWVASAAAWGLASPFFPYLFLWSRCRSMVLGRGSAEVLPSGWFPLTVFLEGVLPPLWRWRVFGWLSLAGPYVLRDVYLVPVGFYPLPLLRYTGSFRRPRCACLGLRPFGKCV